MTELGSVGRGPTVSLTDGAIVATSTIAAQLRRERCRRRMTQSQFADLIETTAARVSMWERGCCTPRLEQLSFIATRIDVRLEFDFENTRVVLQTVKS